MLFPRYERYAKPKQDGSASATDTLRGIAAGALDATGLAPAMQVMHYLALAVLGCMKIPESLKLSRPRIDTLVPALQSLIVAKQRFDTPEDKRLANLSI